MLRSRAAIFLLLVLLLGSDLYAASLRVALPLPAGGAAAWRTLDENQGRPLFLAVTDGLLGFDAATGFVKPGLAESWSVEPGGKVWAFSLRAARWSDGSAVTADDFASAWKRAGVKVVVETTDLRRFKATFAEPQPDVSVFTRPQYLLWPEAGRGCGPFLLGRTDPLVLTKNKSFREASAVLLDGVSFRFTASLDEASALFRDGKVDWVPWGGGPGTLGKATLRHAVIAPGWGSIFMRLNLGSARLGDAAYRQSLSDAVDRTLLAKGLRGPLLLPSSSLVPAKAPVPPAKAPPRIIGPLPEPTLTILYPQGETYTLIAQGVADDWKRRLGILVQTKQESYSRVLEDRLAGTYEVVLSSWMGDYPDPSTFLGLFADPTQVPFIPLFSYASLNQIDLGRWSGWTANSTDVHPWQGVGVRVRSRP